MVDQRQIGIAIPSYNRSDLTIESFYDVNEDERVAQITIVDDASDLEIYEDLKSMTDALPKVKLFRNANNRDCYANKATALSYSNQDWNILLDSDNKIGKDYIDKLFEMLEWDERTIYTPDFAMPQFSFTNYGGLTITKENVYQYIDLPLFETCLNACNYFVNKNKYLEIWDENIDPVTSDSIYMILRWLEAGNRLQIVEGLRYLHKVHEGHYQTNFHRTPIGFHQSILQRLRELK